MADTTLWLKDGKLLTDASGKPILCDHCPCSPVVNNVVKVTKWFILQFSRTSRSSDGVYIHIPNKSGQQRGMQPYVIQRSVTASGTGGLQYKQAMSSDSQQVWFGNISGTAGTCAVMEVTVQLRYDPAQLSDYETGSIALNMDITIVSTKYSSQPLFYPAERLRRIITPAPTEYKIKAATSEEYQWITQGDSYATYGSGYICGEPVYGSFALWLNADDTKTSPCAISGTPALHAQAYGTPICTTYTDYVYSEHNLSIMTALDSQQKSSTASYTLTVNLLCIKGSTTHTPSFPLVGFKQFMEDAVISAYLGSKTVCDVWDVSQSNTDEEFQ